MPKSYPTKNDLPEAARKELVRLLNENLASATHLGLQAKLAHWNVKGPDFFQLHALFEKIYDEATEWTDLIAERAVQLGGVAEATLDLVTQRTKLAEYSLELSGGREHISAFATSMAGFAALVRRAIDTATRAGDLGTADLFTEVSREADKSLWFLEAHLQAER